MEKTRLQHAIERGYYCDIDGNCYSGEGNKLNPILDEGYYVVSIRINKKSSKVPIHRIQAWSTYGKEVFKKGIVARHYDGNSLNNKRNNILLGTHADRVRHGNSAKGTKNGRSKLTEAQVIDIFFKHSE